MKKDSETPAARRGLREYLLLALYMALTMPLFISGVYVLLTWNLPKINSITDYRPPIATRVLCDDGSLCGEFFVERRDPIPIREIPKFVRDAFVASEDERFYEHKGIDWVSIFRALLKNIAAGEIVQGGSTITQQVTKSLLLTPERSLSRKVKEAILAHRIERRLTKDEILEIYLNQIYLGQGAYGIETASRTYFGKKARDLTPAEAAFLAGLPRAPSRYSPVVHPRRAKARQHYVLQRMVAAGYMTREEAERTFAQPVRILNKKEESVNTLAPYFIEEVRRYLEDKYGADMVNREGLTVSTSLDRTISEAARDAVTRGLEDLDKRQGYRGPLAHLDRGTVATFLNKVQADEVDVKPAEFVITREMAAASEEAEDSPVPAKARKETTTLVPGKEYTAVVMGFAKKKRDVEVSVGHIKGALPVEEMSWARKPNPEVDYTSVRVTDPSRVLSVGDVIRVKVIRPAEKGIYVTSLEQDPVAQGALVTLDAGTGEVRAMVGGYDFQKSQFNRAIQAKRQAGSSFKPIYYASALDKGFTPVSVILDAPVVYEEKEKEGSWKPKNYDETFTGPVTLREALAMSRNNPSVRLMESVGVGYAIEYARRLGFTSPLPDDLTLALGTCSVSLMEMTTAYSIFASGGYLRDPILVTKVVDRDGNVLETTAPHFRTPSDELAKGSEALAMTEETLKPGQMISEQTAYLLTDLLKNVVEHGTGWRIKALGRPAAGKTGTSEDYRDAWFIGYTPYLVTGVWVGFDTEESLGHGESGARAASPIWLDEMKQAVRSRPVSDFAIPPGIVFAKIDPKTGLLASADTQDAAFVAFREGTAPTERAPEGSAPSEENFFKYDLGR